MQTAPPGWRTAVWAFFAYCALSVVMTWPAVLHLTTRALGGGGDSVESLWNYWWVKHALIDLKTNPFFTDYVYYPHKNSLALHTLVFLNGLLSIPLQYILPLPAVYNIFIMLAFALSGFAVFLLARRFVEDNRAAFLAGLIFASFRSAEGHAGALVTQWIPFYLLFLLKALDEDEGWLKSSLLAGLFLVFNFYTDYYHFLGALIFTAIVLLYYLLKKEIRPAAMAGRALPVAAVSLPFVLPVVWMVFRQGALDHGLEKVTRVEPVNVTDLAGLFSPNSLNPVLGRISFNHFFTGQESYTYMGAVAAFFSVYALFKLRREKPHLTLWAVSAAVFLVLSMGTHLHILGRVTPVPLPYRLLMQGFLKHLWNPIRLFAYAMLSISVLAACGMERAFKKKGALLFPVLLPAILLEYTVVPQITFDCRIPPIYKTIAADRNAQAVLEVPAFVRTGMDNYGHGADEAPLYYQTFHGKKLFGESLSRVPQRVFLSYLNLPVYRSLFLGTRRLLQARDTDKKDAQDFLDLFGIDYVVVHRTEEYAGFYEGYLRDVLPMDLIYSSPAIAVYKAQHDTGGSLTVQASTSVSVLYLYDGWINGLKSGNYGYAASCGNKAVLLANLKPLTQYRLDLVLAPDKKIKNRLVRVAIDGKALASLALKGGWNIYRVNIPAGFAGSGLKKISLMPAEKIDMAFTGGTLWPRFAVPLPSDYPPGYWEQDNSRFKDVKTSFALHSFTLKKVK